MALITVFKWLSYAILLQLLTISAMDSSDTDEIKQKTKYIELINATQDSLTFLLSFPCHGPVCPEDYYSWAYARGPLFLVVLQSSIEKMSHRKVRINNLAAGSAYRVKVGPRIFLRELQNMKSSFEDPNITVIEASTCPDGPEKVKHVHIYEKGYDFISVWWAAPSKDCLSTAYYVRWSEFDERTHTWNRERDGKCPTDGVLVANTSDVQCEDDPETICYTIKENLTASTQYIVEVITTDYSGICSDPEDSYGKTRYDYWGGITVGGWCLIVVCFILAIGAMPLVIRMKRRLAMQMSSKENIMFKRSQRHGDNAEDEERDPDGYLISNSTDRHIEIQPNQS